MDYEWAYILWLLALFVAVPVGFTISVFWPEPKPKKQPPLHPPRPRHRITSRSIYEAAGGEYVVQSDEEGGVTVASYSTEGEDDWDAEADSYVMQMGRRVGAFTEDGRYIHRPPDDSAYKGTAMERPPPVPRSPHVERHQRLTPVEEGRRARELAASIVDNPYEENSLASNAWLRGFAGFPE